MYKCSKCGREVEKTSPGHAKCPYCGNLILIKSRPEIVHKVRAE